MSARRPSSCANPPPPARSPTMYQRLGPPCSRLLVASLPGQIRRLLHTHISNQVLSSPLPQRAAAAPASPPAVRAELECPPTASRAWMLALPVVLIALVCSELPCLEPIIQACNGLALRGMVPTSIRPLVSPDSLGTAPSQQLLGHSPRSMLATNRCPLNANESVPSRRVL